MGIRPDRQLLVEPSIRHWAATCWIACSSLRKSTGLVRCSANPAERLSSMSSDDPNPESAIARHLAADAERPHQFQPAAVRQLDVADQHVEIHLGRDLKRRRQAIGRVDLVAPQGQGILAR